MSTRNKEKMYETTNKSLENRAFKERMDFFKDTSHVYKTFLEVQQGIFNPSHLERAREIGDKNPRLPPFIRYLLRKELASFKNKLDND